MDFEELSKSQLVLLTILVNFVTSVATGILTVSLLDYAPPSVTQTVNRVVSHTIETVTQVAPQVAAVAATPAPSNQELVTSAIGAAAAHLVALYPISTASSTLAAAVGTYLPSERVVVTAAQDALPKKMSLVFADGTTLLASLSKEGNGIAIWSFAPDAKLPSATSPTLLASDTLQLGETVLAIGADGGATTGIVSRVSGGDVYTTLPDIGVGSAAVNLDGNVVGLAAGGTPGRLLSADRIAELLGASADQAAGDAPRAGST